VVFPTAHPRSSALSLRVGSCLRLVQKGDCYITFSQTSEQAVGKLGIGVPRRRIWGPKWK